MVAVVANLAFEELEAPEAETLMWIEEWREAHGYDSLQYTFIDSAARLDVLRAGLAALPAPLDGLAVCLDVVRGHTGNVWLDCPSVVARYEYMDGLYMWEHDWCPSCLAELAIMYQQVGPRLQQLEAYQTWYMHTSDAEHQVMTLLTCMVDHRWHVQDGRVVIDE